MENSEERYNSIAEHINKHKIKTACDGVDSRLCLAFGTFSQEIKSYFAGFTDFQFATAVNLIGKDSGNNGFVNEIVYEREGFNADTYKSYAILKSSRLTLQNAPDNLMYEYRVGQYINKFNRIYPCFLETYGLLKYKTDEAWQILKSENLKYENDESAQADRLTSLKEGLAIQPLDYSADCTDYHKLAILIQHFNNFKALSDLINNDDFIRIELMYVLFQLYIPLAQMKDTFTHYDLHWNNLHVYEPVPGKYIQYHYHLVPGMAPVSFKSKYMLKIIDYGRCYFKDEDEDENSQTIIDKICKNNQTICDNDDGCGKNVGSMKHIKTNQNEDLYPFIKINEAVKYKLKLMKRMNIEERGDLKTTFLDKVIVNDKLDKENLYFNEKMSYADFLHPAHSNRGGTKKMRRTRIRRAKSPKTTKKKRRTRVRRTKSLKTTKKMRRRGAKSPKTTKKMRRTHVGGAKQTKEDVDKYFAEKINTVQDAANHLVYYVNKEKLKEKNNLDYKNNDEDKDDEDKELNKFGDLHVYLDGREMMFDKKVKKDKKDFTPSHI